MLERTTWSGKLQAAVVIGLGLMPLGADAAVNCSTIQNPLFVAGSSALEPLYKAIGKSLATDPNNPVTLVYQKPGSCAGLAALGQKLTTNFLYIDATFDGVNVPTCTNDIAGGVGIDIGISDVFYDNCTGGTALAAPYQDFLGPVQAMLFVVPKASSQKAITAEEAYYTFGFGQSGQASPWVDETQLCVRNKDSGTQRLLAAAIRVPAERWKGVSNAASSDVLTCLTTVGAATPDKTIGILGADIYDQGANRNNLTALAFRAFQQYKAYYPDSSLTALDKRNVRDGHYVPFGYAHLVTAVTAGVPTNPKAAYFINLLQGSPVTPPPSFDALSAIVKNGHLVPQCAMQVQRKSDGGDLSLYASPTPCGCFYETAVSGTVPATCTACTMDSGCTSNHCRFGYCEAR